MTTLGTIIQLLNYFGKEPQIVGSSKESLSSHFFLSSTQHGEG